MTRRFRSRRTWLALLLLLPMLLLAAPRGTTANPAQRVMERVRLAQEGLPAWRAGMLIDIDLPGMKVKGKRVGIRHTPPDRFDFDAKGFALLPRKALMWTADSLFAGLSEPRLSPARPGDPRGSVRLGGLFREDGLLARMDYRVDTLRWLVTQVNTWHDTLKAVQLENDYIRVGGHWLPSAVRVDMRLTPELQRFYERLRATMRQRKTPREGRGTVRIVLDGHRLGA